MIESNKSASTVEGGNKTFVDYSPLEMRKREREESLYHQDSVYIYFEEGFTVDLLELEVNQYKVKEVLSTDEMIGLAARFVLPNVKEGKLYIKKNNADLLVIDLKKSITNKWAINFYNDTLFAKSLKYAPTYE